MEEKQDDILKMAENMVKEETKLALDRNHKGQGTAHMHTVKESEKNMILKEERVDHDRNYKGQGTAQIHIR